MAKALASKPGTPTARCFCALVVNDLLAQFETAVAERLQYLMTQGASDAITFGLDTPLDCVFHAFAAYCPFCIQRMLTELLAWRNTRHVRLLSDAAQEQHHLAIDIVFVEACIAALSQYDGDTVPEEFATAIENAAHEFCRMQATLMAKMDAAARPIFSHLFSGGSQVSQPSSSMTREYLFDLWSLILGRISVFHVAQFASRFLHGIDHDDIAAVHAYRMLRSVDLRLDSEPVLNHTMQFIQLLFRMLNECTGRPSVKRAIAEAMTCILYPVAMHPTQASVNLTTWYALMQQIYVYVRRWARKPRRRAYAYPLLTVVLCNCEPEHFITNFGVLLESLIAVYDDRDTRLIGIACIQRLFHVYLEQIAYRKNATSNNLLTIVRRIVFGDHKRLPYVDGTHQMEHDGLVALILTVAEGKFDFCVSEVILRMLQFGEGDDIINEYVQLALRALIAIFDRGERRTRLFTSAWATNELLPPGFRTHYGPSIATMLEAIGERLCTLQPFQSADLGPYVHQLGLLLGLILKQCYRAIGQTLLTSSTQSSIKASPTTCAPLGSNLLDPKTETIHLPTLIYRFALSVLPYVWTESVPESELLRWVVQASIHQNGGIRVAAGYVIDSIQSNPRDRNMIGRFLGRLSEYISGSVALAYDEVALHLLENMCRIMLSLPDRPDRMNITLTDDQADQMEAAALFWLSSANTRIRLLCFRILEAIRRTVNVYNDGLASDDDDDAATQVETTTFRSPSVTSHSPRRRRLRRVCVLNVIEMHEQVIIAAHDRHTLPDLNQTFGSAPSKVKEYVDVDHQVLSALCNRTSAIRIIHAATCKPGAHTQDRWTTYLAEIIRRLAHARFNCSLRSLFPEAAAQINTFLSDRNMKLPKDAFFQYRNLGIAALVAAGSTTEYPHMQLADLVVSRCVHFLHTNADSPHAVIAMTALGNVSFALIESVLSSLPLNAHPARVTFVYRLIAEGLTSSLLLDHENVRTRFISFVQKTCAQMEHESLADHELRQSFAIIVRRLCEESNAEPCRQPLEQSLRVQLFTLLSKWIAHPAGASRSASRRETSSPESVPILTAMASLLLGPFLDSNGQVPDGQVFPWINSVLKSSKPPIRDIGSLALQNVLVSNPTSLVLCYYANQCYAGEVPVARRYFLAIGEFWMNNTNTRLSLAEIVHLIIYKLGDKSFTVRSMAMDMVPVLAEKRPGSLYGCNVPHMVISSRLPDTYLQTQMEVSKRVSKEYSSITDEFLSTLWKYLPLVPPYDQLIMLRYCQCWIQGINLTGKLGSRMIEILFRVTVEHGVHFAVELQQIWRELAATRTKDGQALDNLRCTIKFILVKCCLCEIEKASRHVDMIFETAKRIILYLSRVAQTEVIQLLISEIEQESDSVFGALPESDDDGHSQNLTDTELVLKKLDHAHSEGLLAAPGLYPPSESGDEVRHRRRLSRSKTTRTQGNPSTSHIALMLLVEVAYEMKSEALGQFQSHVMLMQHWALLGLDHQIFEIREHCKFLLLNLIHALTFHGFDNNAFSDDNNQEEHRGQVARRNKARQLMDYLMSGDGNALWRREIITDANMVLDSVDAMTAVARPLLEICDTPNAVKLWSQYAINHAKHGGPLIASRSLQIFRILTEDCQLDEVSGVVKRLLEFLHVSNDASVISEALSTLVVILDRVQPGNSSLLDDLSHLLWHCVDVLGSKNVPVHLFVHVVTLLIQLLDKISVEDHVVRIAIMRKRLAPFQGLQPLVLDGLAAGCVVRQPAYILLSKLTLSGFSAFIDPSDARILHNFIGLFPWLCEHVSIREYPATVSLAARNLRRLSETRLDDIKLSRGLAAFERHEMSTASQFCEALAPSLTLMMKRHGDDTVFDILTGMLRVGSVEQQRTIVVILTSLFWHLHWQHTSLRHHGYGLFTTLIEMQNGVLRNEIMALISIALEKTCSASGVCADWVQDVDASPISPVDVVPPLILSHRSPSPPAERRSPSPAPRKELTAPTAPSSTQSPIPSSDDDDDRGAARNFTWSAEWARRRRLIYSTHSRRLSFISNQFRDDQTATSPRLTMRNASFVGSNPILPSAPPGDSPQIATLTRTPSKLYPALYRHHSSDISAAVAWETRRSNEGWSSPMLTKFDGFGFLRRRSSTQIPSAPSIEKDFGLWERRMASPASVKSDGGTNRSHTLGRPPRTPPVPVGQRPFRMTPDDQVRRR